MPKISEYALVTPLSGDMLVLERSGQNKRADFSSFGGGLPQGHLFGLTLSNNGSDATNDIDIATGRARDGGNTADMVLASALTKRLDAAWAVGTNQGGLDTGVIANTTYHIWLIKRSDTGVVDVLFSTSASAPTMPTNYGLKRRIGSLRRVSGAWQLFVQTNDEFKLKTPVSDYTDSALGTAAADFTLASIPSGIIVNAMITCVCWKSGVASRVHLWPKTLTDQTSTFYNSQLFDISAGLGSSWTGVLETNTTPAIRAVADSASTNFSILTRGWIDSRGRLA